MNKKLKKVLIGLGFLGLGGYAIYQQRRADVLEGQLNESRSELKRSQKENGMLAHALGKKSIPQF